MTFIYDHILTRSRRAKMYKTRFKKWGWRKNIHIKQQEYLELLNTRTKKGSSVPQKEIKLPNGLVVNHNRLSVYLDRKSRREQYAKAVQRPVFICYPGTSRGLEMVLTQVQKLIVSSMVALGTFEPPILLNITPPSATPGHQMPYLQAQQEVWLLYEKP